jgi:hypothetical protein
MPEVFLAIVITISAQSTRSAVGKHCWREAFYFGAYQNAAMMDVVGYGDELKWARRVGDQGRIPSLRAKLAEARAKEADYARTRKVYMGVASSLGMPMARNYSPPGTRPPMPTYGPR